MKPIMLSMQAFGPFSDRQHVNFKLLGENPLFLINGPTGAGKSTLLDAICFALYGESTGKEREPAAMRCDLASPDLATEVDFAFQLANYVYRIIRSPSQMLTKKKGTGTTIKGPTAVAYRYKDPADFDPEVFNDSDSSIELLPLKGVKEVNEWVSELTGLSSEQFRQVMVLPQGQFRKLLLADSDQREAIFSQLFQTHIYKQIEEQLKLQSTDLRNHRKALNDKVAGLLESVNLSSMAELNEQIQSIEPEYNHAKKDVEAKQLKRQEAEKALQSALSLEQKIKQKTELTSALAGLESKHADIAAAKKELESVNQALAIRPVQHQWQQSEQRLKQEQSLQSEVQQAVEKLLQQRNENHDQLNKITPLWQSLDDKKLALAEWQRKKQLLSALNTDKVQHKKIAAQLKQIEESIQSNEQSQGKLESEINTNAETLQGITTRLLERPKIEAAFSRYEHLGRVKAKVEESAEQLTSLGQKLCTTQVALETKAQELQQHQVALQQTELSWHLGQAVELARQLKAGEPCLVCGSLEHPSPAHQGEQAFASKDQVDQARAALSESQKLTNNLQMELDSLRYKQGEVSHRIAELNEELGDQSVQSITWFREQWQRSKTTLKELDELQTQQSTLERQQKENSQQLDSWQNEHNRLKAQREQCLLERSTLDARIKEREVEIPKDYRQEGAVDNKLHSLQREIETISTQYQQVVEAQQHIAQQLSAKQSLLNDITSRISQLTHTLEVDQLAWKEALQNSGFETEAIYLDYCWRSDKIEQQQALIEQHEAKLANVKAQLSFIENEIKDTPESNVDSFLQQVDLCKQASDEANEHFHQVSNQFTSLQRVDKKLEAIQKEVDKLEAQYKVVGTLSDVASGQTGNRVSLQRFVLGVLLDDVLAEASQRLQLMSKGRYRLTRKLDRSKGNKTSGLELEIEDAYSGARRPANTLSGGESFMAALSLALGLSDVVQSYSGGIKLDTLFIDEGFGSLDVESLDLAIQTLVDLRKSGRTVGIISHVSELKEQMSQRIDVRPSDRGSHIEIVAAL